VIFVGFGGDLWCPGGKPEWRQRVFEVERQCPQHVFVHLTKNPKEILNDRERGNWQAWYGASVCGRRELDFRAACLLYRTEKRWLSFEPLITDVELYSTRLLGYYGVRFIVIGGLSNGAGRIIPPSEEYGLRAEWAQPIIDAAADAGCRIFLKNLHRDVWTRLVNPRTGELMRSAVELREVPDEWRMP
jgi:protein gp37